jgi:internalin A
MAHDAAILKDIRKAVKAHGKEFKELPQLKQMIELARQYQGTELRAKRDEIGLDYRTNGYALGAGGQAIGLQLYEVQLPDYTFLPELRRLNYLSLSSTCDDLIDKTFVQKGLSWLRGYKPFSDLMPLTELSALTELDVSDNQISDLTPLAKLSALTELDVSDNQISDLTPLARLSALTEFDVSGNQSSDLTPLAGLTQLTTLDVGKNQISDLMPLAGLSALTELDVSDNQISDLMPLVGLTHLKFLDLHKNKITVLSQALVESGLEIHWEIGEEMKLDKKTSKKISRIIPSYEARMSRLYGEGIILEGNPMEIPPPEVVKQGTEAVRNYFHQLEAAGQDYLYEAKLLIVGEPGAGKTTLAKKILDPTYQLDRAEVSTKGIDVMMWEFPVETGRRPVSTHPFRVNIWDFGGQEIYHATHQFFLTKRSLYVLVADTRKDDTDFYY